MTAVHHLAFSLLCGPTVHHWPSITPALRARCLAACGVGCDHLEGEELVALIDDTRAEGVIVGAVVTSRRYCYRNMTGAGEVHWSDLAAVTAEPDALVTAHLCTLHGGKQVRLPPTSTNTTDFFDAVLSLRGEARALSVRPLPHERDKARRALMERSQRFGRGQHRGSWLSPCAPDQLARALAILLGPPLATGAHGQHLVCDFTLPEHWRHLGVVSGPEAQRNTIIAAGYGRAFERIRLIVNPSGPGSSFSLNGILDGTPALPLSNANPVLLGALFTDLLNVEDQILDAAPPPRPSPPAFV